MELVDNTKCSIENKKRTDYNEIKNVFWNTIKNLSEVSHNQTTTESIEKELSTSRSLSKTFVLDMVYNILREVPLPNPSALLTQVHTEAQIHYNFFFIAKTFHLDKNKKSLKLHYPKESETTWSLIYK